MKRLYQINDDFEIHKVKKFKTLEEKKQERPIPRKNNLSVVNYINIGYYIITPLLVGVFLGLGIDKLLRLKGVFVLVFIFLGMIGSFYNMYKIYKNEK